MRAEPPIVDGYRLFERCDSAGAGEVWRARVTGGLAGHRGDPLPGQLAGVGERFVRLLRLPADEAMRAKARIVAEDLLELDDAGLVRIREVRRAFDGLALVLEPLAAPLVSLQHIARRRQLSAGEAVTLGVALSWALSAAHTAGLCHGRLRDADVLLDPAGRPLLAGVGVLAVLGGAATPADDVLAVTRLLASMLDRSSAGADRVTAVLTDRHPGAAQLAARLAAATPAMPIALESEALGDTDAGAGGHGSAGPGSPRRQAAGPRLGGLVDGVLGRQREHRRAGRVLRLCFVAAALVVLAGVIGWASASGERSVRGAGPVPPSSVAPAGAARPTDWRAELERLDAGWAVAFQTADPKRLDAVDVPASSAYRTDAAALALLRARGAHARGLRLVVERIAVRSSGADSVILSVVDRRSRYELRDRQGTLLQRVSERPSAAHAITLRATGPPGHRQWRIATVADVTASS